MKRRTKQIMAWIIIAILVLMYLSTLVFALIDAPWATSAFRVSIVSTILLPIMFYLIIFFTKMLTPAHGEIVEGGQQTEAGEEATEETEGND